MAESAVAFVLSFAMVCTLLAGVNVVAFAADSDESLTDTVSVLRAYNPNNGEHLMTVDGAEYNANVARGYSGEGQAWVAPLHSNTEVWRAYNPNSGEHMLAPEAEVKALEAAGWQNEGLKMYSCEDEENVPIYRVFNPNANDAGSHHYCGKEEAEGLVAIGWKWDNNGEPVIYGCLEEPPVGGEVTLSTTSPKVGDTIKASVKLVGTDTVEGYQWTLNGAEIEGATNSSYTVPATANRGDLISVVVHTSAGEILEPTTKATVSIAAATLIDEDGLQEDGTAVVNDTLRITYTSDLGNPQNVTWYRDGTAVKTSSAMDFGFTLNATKAGNYYATITAADGTVYTSNTITCSDKELPAVLTDFAITEDTNYGVTATKGAEKVDYATETDNLIATVTMNKLYAGDFYVVKASSKDYAKDKITLNDMSATGDFDLETNINAFTDLNALTNYYDNGGDGLVYKNTDGSVTFKIVLDGDKDLKRGESYMLLFHQTAIPASNPGKGDEIMTLPDEAPYLEAPASVVVSKAQAGSGVELEFRDADGNKLDWFGAQGVAGATDVGITSAIMYKASENVAGSGTNLNNANKDVEKGTLTGTGNGDSNYQYYSAVVTFKKGIYSEEQLTLTTEAKALATQSLNAMALYNNKVNPTTATVKFNNLVTDGVVGILHTESGTLMGGNFGDQYKEDLKAVQNGDLSKLTGMAVVSKGTSKVDIEGAITSVDEDADGMDIYVPVFLPNDTEGYTTVYAENGDLVPKAYGGGEHWNTAMMDIPDTIQADAKGKVWLLVNSQKETKYSMTGSVSNLAVNTGAAVQITLNGGTVKANDAANGDTNLVKVYDQYGDEFETEVLGDYTTALSGLTFELKKTSSVVTAATSVTLKIDNIGKAGTTNQYTGLVLTVNDDAKNSTWEAITSAGQVITVKFNSTGLVTITIE